MTDNDPTAITTVKVPKKRGRPRKTTAVVTLPARFIPRFWEDQDNRQSLVKLIKRRIDELSSHVGADSAQKKILVQRAAFIAVRLETMEVAATLGEGLEGGLYAQLSSTLLGLLRALGLEKKVRKLNLQAYVEGKGK